MKLITLGLITLFGIFIMLICLYIGFIGIAISIQFNELAPFMVGLLFLLLACVSGYSMIQLFNYVNYNL